MGSPLFNVEGGGGRMAEDLFWLFYFAGEGDLALNTSERRFFFSGGRRRLWKGGGRTAESESNRRKDCSKREISSEGRRW